jgi:hypothetical protein
MILTHIQTLIIGEGSEPMARLADYSPTGCPVCDCVSQPNYAHNGFAAHMVDATNFILCLQDNSHSNRTVN